MQSLGRGCTSRSVRARRCWPNESPLANDSSSEVAKHDSMPSSASPNVGGMLGNEDSSTQNRIKEDNRPWLNFLINTAEGQNLKKADPERAEELCSVIDNLANEGHLSKGELDLAHKLQVVFSIGESINISALEDYEAFKGLTDQLDAELLSQQEELARVIRSHTITEEDDLEESLEDDSEEGDLVDEAPSEDND